MNRIVGEKVLYPELSFQLMEIMFEVHNQLGPGFSEDIYEKAVILELKTRKIPFEEQKVIQVCYKGQPLGVYRLDLVIDNKIIVELKAVAEYNEIFKQQLLSYLKATHLKLGLLINFGKKKVESIRVLN
jgi:GxxExxY protein